MLTAAGAVGVHVGARYVRLEVAQPLPTSEGTNHNDGPKERVQAPLGRVREPERLGTALAP